MAGREQESDHAPDAREHAGAPTRRIREDGRPRRYRLTAPKINDLCHVPEIGVG